MAKQFDELISKAEQEPFAGWDFSYVKERMVETTLPWNYLAEVRERLKGVFSLLDLGTGGGEIFSQLAPFPARTFATEEYMPNVPIAARRLHPLGAQVVRYEAPMENYPQIGAARWGKPRLPFRDDAFDLVIDRHEAYLSVEVFRVLKPGARFITQQCGGTNYLELNDLLGVARPSYEPWCLASANAQLQRAGFERIMGREQVHPTFFHDVGALLYFLRSVPWQLPDFRPSRYLGPLREIHQRIEHAGPLRISAHHFIVEGAKPHAR
jgi:SAM-dependent methyltransferase